MLARRLYKGTVFINLNYSVHHLLIKNYTSKSKQRVKCYSTMRPGSEAIELRLDSKVKKILI